MSPDPADRARGCLLGLAAGDAIGAPHLGLSAAELFRQHGLFTDILAKLPVVMTLTADTTQALAVAAHLAGRDDVAGEELVKSLARGHRHDRPADRGTRGLFDAVNAGADFRAAAADARLTSNDVAVRCAAVGLRFAGDLDRVWVEAKACARATHADALAVEGAQLFAAAVALAASGEAIDRKPFLHALLDRAAADEYRWALRTAVKLKRSDSVAVLGCGFDAVDSVVTAVACFAATPTDYPLAVGRALGLGGDTSTLAAMTGALCGAAGGVAAVPVELAGRLEPLRWAELADALAARPGQAK